MDIGFSVDVLFFLSALKLIILLCSVWLPMSLRDDSFVLLFSSMQCISLSLLTFKYFVLWIILLALNIRNLCLTQGHKDFLLVFFSSVV